MKKKNNKKIIIMVIVTLIILGIGAGIGFVYLKTSDKMVSYVLTDLLEAEVAKGLGEEIGDEIVISDPKILENLGISLSSLEQEAEESINSVVINNGSDTNVTAATDGEVVTTDQKESTETNASNGEASNSNSQNSKPIKVSKKQLEKAIEKKVETVTSQVPVSDKTNMTNLVLKYIDKSDVSYLTSLMLDGVSSEDLAIAKQIAKKSFPEEAMDDVYNYYKKYAGLVANN